MRLPNSNHLAKYLEEGKCFSIEPKVVHGSSYKTLKTNAKVLLIQPPITLSEGSIKRVIPPLGISYIAASLLKEGIECDILDCIVEGVHDQLKLNNGFWKVGLSDDSIRGRIAAIAPDVIGVSVLYSSDLPRLFEVARIAKQVNDNIIVVAGGLHASIYPIEVLSESIEDGRPTIDYVLRGEGESRLPLLITQLKSGSAVSVPGLCGWSEGGPVVTPQGPPIADLNSLEFPAYGKLPMETYFRYNVPFSPFPKGKRVSQILTSRGCPVGCTFCASTNFNKAYRTRSIENVIREIKWLKKVYEIDEVQFADDNLTFNRVRAKELFQILAKENLSWCTPNGTMVNTLSEDLINCMVDSGMYQITLSLDSGSKKTLKNEHRKPVNLDKVPDILNQLLSRNVLVHCTLVIGMPNETEDDIHETFNYISSLNFTSLAVFLAQPLPGSELYESMIDSGRIEREQSRLIDTARVSKGISTIAPDRLQKLASDFSHNYNLLAKQRNTDAWSRKYDSHISRLSSMCAGIPAPNTSGIIAAAAT